MIDKSTLIDHVIGCLVGATIGDALGYSANGMTTWQVLRKFNLIDGFYSVNGVFGRYSEQSKKMLLFSSEMIKGIQSNDDWTANLKDFASKEKMPFAAKAIPIGIASAMLGLGDMGIRDVLKNVELYSDKSEGLALLLMVKLISQCIRNHDQISRPYDLYDSEGSVLNNMYLVAATAEDGMTKTGPIRDSFGERMSLVRSRLMRNDDLWSFVGISGAGEDYFESVSLATFAFMNEPDEVSTIYKTASLGHAASQNAALVGALVGGYLGVSYLHDLKDQVENSTKINVLGAEIVEAFLPTPEPENEETSNEGEV